VGAAPENDSKRNDRDDLEALRNLHPGAPVNNECRMAKVKKTGKELGGRSHKGARQTSQGLPLGRRKWAFNLLSGWRRRGSSDRPMTFRCNDGQGAHGGNGWVLGGGDLKV